MCYCAHIPTLPTRTRVAFVQHLRERRMPIGTAWMAHLALPNSEFHVGLDFAGDARVEALAREPGAFVLFPEGEARDVTTLAPGELRTLVVVDGTWPLARKLVKVNPALRELPRVAFQPERPGNYRIRREPAAHCLSTVEAVAEVLGYLEGEPERFRRMLAAFDAMVDAQLEHKAARTGPSRYAHTRPRGPTTAVRVAEKLRAMLPKLVLVYAESNVLPGPNGTRRHELLQLAALRIATGERFEALLLPSGPLDENAPRHLELPREVLLGGEERASALRRWAEFLHPGDVLAGWARLTQALMRVNAPGFAFFDLREATARVLKRRPGGLDAAPAALGSAESPVSGVAEGRGRAGRRLAALERVVRGLLRS